MTMVLFWDIDGTLLTTGRAGIFAWEAAAREVADRPVDLQRLQTAGLTDYAVGRSILEHLDLTPDREVLTRMVRSYESHLPDVLPRRKGRVLEGIADVLRHVRDVRADVRSRLLTGNTEAGARAKLTHYGLVDYFDGGAFAEEADSRIDIAWRALESLGDSRRTSPGRVYVIGDTPHDVTCGQAIGARTIAVATGEYSVDQLREHDPWRTLAVVPAPESFFALLEGTD